MFNANVDTFASILAVKALLGLAPAIVYLAVLLALDSYKLVKLRTVLTAITAGCLGMLVCFLLHDFLSGRFALGTRELARYVSPITEEVVKSLLLIWMIRRRRIGFLIDAAILGFATGVGFGLCENIYYLSLAPDRALPVWILRGCGSALMHGSTTAIFAVISQRWCEWRGAVARRYFLPGLVVAVVAHSIFNHFFVSPAWTAVGQVLVLPLAMLLVCRLSDRSLVQWLDFGFDTDAELLAIINSGKVSETPAGRYLISLRRHFPPAIVADMYCLLALQVELSVRAKGMLMMRREGFRVAPVSEVKEKLAELAYLERSIGRTGRLALRPFRQRRRRDAWEKFLLKRQ